MDDPTRAPAPPMPTVLAAARAYAAGGLALVPVPPDGSKRPRVPWRRFRRRPPDDAQLAAWFAAGRDGPAALGGAASGGLEVLDFDEAALFAPWGALVDAHARGLLARLPIVRSPGPGYHVYLRCPGHAAGNQKLALGAGPGGRPVTLIETRGEGGLVLTPACPPACHPSGRSYVLKRGDLGAVPAVTPAQRGLLLDAARSLTRHVPPRFLVVGLPGASRPPRGAGAPATASTPPPGGLRSWSRTAGAACARTARGSGTGAGRGRRGPAGRPPPTTPAPGCCTSS